jgi:hypothetical protein
MSAYHYCIMSFRNGCYWLNTGSKLYMSILLVISFLFFLHCPIPYILLSQDLKDFMRKAGEVSYADVRRDRDSEG